VTVNSTDVSNDGGRLEQSIIVTGSGNDQVTAALTGNSFSFDTYDTNHLPVFLGTEDDTFQAKDTNAIAFDVYPGKGKDEIHGSNAYITKNLSPTEIVTDRFIAEATPDGDDLFESPIPGGGAEVSYEQRTTGVNVTLDGKNNDGEPGKENDNVRESISRVVGGSGQDVIDMSLVTVAFTQSFMSRTASGGSGDDTLTSANSTGRFAGYNLNVLDGGADNDTISGTPAAQSGCNEALIGGPGDDTIEGNGSTYSYPELLFGGADNDTLRTKGGGAITYFAGGDGNDTMEGGKGDSFYQLAGTTGVAEGDDTVKDTGSSTDGIDTISYGSTTHSSWSNSQEPLARTTAIQVSFDGVANDGAVSGEKDNIHPGIEAVRGGDGDDILDLPIASLAGNGGNDKLSNATEMDGGTGNDELRAKAGVASELNGGDDDDTLVGKDQDDQLDGGHGDDTLLGGEGDNDIWDPSGKNTLTSGSGNDTLRSGSGDDTLEAGDGTNTLKAGDGTNTLTTGSGNDTLQSGSGTDKLEAGDGTNRLYAGDGNDTLRSGSGNDTLDGERGNDQIAAGEGANSLTGGSGNDTLTSGNQNDTLNGGTDDDTLESNGGDDKLVDAGGSDLFVGGDGNDTFDLADSAATDSDRFLGGNGNDVVTAKAAASHDLKGTISIDSGNNDDVVALDKELQSTVNAGDGNDTVYAKNADGGDGNDGLYQVADYKSSGEYTLDGGSGDDLVIGSEAFAPDGCYRNESNKVVDHLGGGDGNDLLAGGGGNDILHGGAGDDRLAGGRICGKNISSGVLTAYTSSLAIDTLAGDSGNDLLIGNTDDQLDGGQDDDTIALEKLESYYGTYGTPSAIGDINGGSGTDTVNYEIAERSQTLCGVQASLDDQPNDGNKVSASYLDPAPGNRHNAHSDIENITGTYCSDLLTGSNAANVIRGGTGGPDTIVGGKGPDVLDGGDWGYATIDARDGERDEVTCSPAFKPKGGDAQVDSLDVVNNCETVTVGKTPDPTEGKPCSVSKVTGTPLKTAANTLTKSNCTVQSIRWWVTSRTKDGKVLKQDRKPGTYSPKQLVTLTVGQIPTAKRCQISRLIGKTTRSANKILAKQQCNVVYRYKRVKNKRRYDKVIAQSVRGTVRSATTVKLTIGVKK